MNTELFTLNQEKMKKPILDHLKKQILVGILLGDGSLQTFNNGKTYRLRILQKNKDYVFHLYNIFEPFCTGVTPPQQSTVQDTRTQKSSTRW